MQEIESSRVKSQKDALSVQKMFRGDRVEILNHQLDRLAAQLRKNVPFVGEMLIDQRRGYSHDLFSDLAKRHGLVSAIGKHFAGSRKDFAPQPLLTRLTGDLVMWMSLR